MKRKSSYCATEASFDSLMADAGEDKELKSSGEVSVDRSSPSPSKIQPNFNSLEEEDAETEYEEPDVDCREEVTTLRMLFEKCRSSDVEFYESCLDVGLLSQSNSKCIGCDSESLLIEDRCSLDSLYRSCAKCDVKWSIRRDSWIEGIEASLKDITLSIYCWCRGFSQTLTIHEIQIDVDIVSIVFSKCLSVADAYYQNQLSNIGGRSKIVLTDIFTYNDRLILCLFEQHSKNLFFELLKPDYDESRIVTILIDNLMSGTTLVTSENSRISKVLDPECLSYLKESWDIDFKSEAISTESLILFWTEFESQLPPVNSIDPAHIDSNPDLILRQALFRKRMDNSKDNFLFFLTVISDMFNSCYS